MTSYSPSPHPSSNSTSTQLHSPENSPSPVGTLSTLANNGSSGSSTILRLKKPSPCEPCKMRRVKCERPDDDPSKPCFKCSQKSISCVTLPKVKKARTLNRDGSVILKAREAFGSTNHTVEDTRQSSAGAVVPSKSKLSIENFSSIGQGLGVDARIKQLRIHLMESFFSSSLSFPHIINFANFQKRWDNAGRNPAAMSPQDEVLCSIVIASAARTCDVPQLYGAIGNTLSSEEHDRFRDGICSSLFRAALDAFNSKSLPFKPSAETISCSMMLLHGIGRRQMFKSFTPSEYKATRKVLSRLVVEHLLLLKDEDEDSFLNFNFINEKFERHFGMAGAAWANFTIDCFYSAIEGRNPTFTQRDFEVLCIPSFIEIEQLKHLAPLSKEALFLPDGSIRNDWTRTFLLPLLKEFGRISLAMGTWHMRIKAWKPEMGGYLDDDTLIQVLLSLARLIEIYPHILEALEKVPTTSYLWCISGTFPLALHVYSVLKGNIVLQVGLLTKIMDVAKNKGMKLRPGAEQTERVIDGLNFYAAKELAFLFDSLRIFGRYLGAIPMFGVLLDFVPHFISFLISSPTVEDFTCFSGNSPQILKSKPPEDFTRLRKLKQIETFIFAVENFEKIWGKEPWIVEALENLNKEKSNLETLIDGNSTLNALVGNSSLGSATFNLAPSWMTVPTEQVAPTLMDLTFLASSGLGSLFGSALGNDPNKVEALSGSVQPGSSPASSISLNNEELALLMRASESLGNIDWNEIFRQGLA